MPNYPAVIPNNGNPLPSGIPSSESWEDTVKLIWKLNTLQIQGDISDGVDIVFIVLNAMTGECIADGYTIPLFNDDGVFPVDEAGKFALQDNARVFRHVSGQGTDPGSGYEYEFESTVGATVTGGQPSFTLSGRFACNFGAGSLVLEWQTETVPGWTEEPLLGTSVIVYRTPDPLFSFAVLGGFMP